MVKRTVRDGPISSGDKRQDQFRVGDRGPAGVRHGFRLSAEAVCGGVRLDWKDALDLDYVRFFAGLVSHIFCASLDSSTAVLDPFCISYCSK